MSSSRRSQVALPRPIDVQAALAEGLARIAPAGDAYALIGGVALAVHGVERFTKDVDLATTVQHTAKAEPLVADLDPKPLRIGGLSFATTTGVRVNLIDRRFEYRGLFEEAIAEAKRAGVFVRAGDRELVVATLPYLAAVKLIADRPQDEVDLRALLEKEALDYAATRDIVLRHVGPYAARRLDRLARIVHRRDAPEDYDAADK